MLVKKIGVWCSCNCLVGKLLVYFLSAFERRTILVFLVCLVFLDPFPTFIVGMVKNKNNHKAHNSLREHKELDGLKKCVLSECRE